MNATTKAPIVNSSAETISGAATIRAFDMVDEFKRKNLKLIDDDASLYYYKFAALEWLVLCIESSCTVIITSAALLVLLKNGISPGKLISILLVLSSFKKIHYVKFDRPFMVIPYPQSAGLAGLSITYSLALNNCQIYLSFRQCTLAIFIIAVERVKQYMSLPSEAAAIIETNRPPAQWPNKGTIVLENLYVRTQFW